MPNDPRPLVITEVGGGLVQVQYLIAGTGVPEAYVLDFDREGCDAYDLRLFRTELRRAARSLRRRPVGAQIWYDGHVSGQTLDILADAYENTAREYTLKSNPGRYR